MGGGATAQLTMERLLRALGEGRSPAWGGGNLGTPLWIHPSIPMLAGNDTAPAQPATPSLVLLLLQLVTCSPTPEEIHFSPVRL